MIISVQRGLREIKEGLEARGHMAVYDDEYAHPAGAYIYKGGRAVPQTHMSHGTLFSKASYYGGISGNISQQSGFSDSPANAVIRIDASGMTFDEVERILLEKRGTSFF